MKGIQKGFWAKINFDERGTVASWQPLEAHCADVAAVTEALLKRSILRSRLGYILAQERFSDVQTARLCVLAVLHDVGKVNHGFQDRAYSHNAPRIGHVAPLIDFMDWTEGEKSDIIEALNLAMMCDWFESEDDLVAFLLSTFSHHGKPVHPSPRFSPELWRANEKRDPINEMRHLRFMGLYFHIRLNSSTRSMAW